MPGLPPRLVFIAGLVVLAPADLRMHRRSEVSLPLGGAGLVARLDEGGVTLRGAGAPILSVRTVAWGRPDHLVPLGAREPTAMTCAGYDGTRPRCGRVELVDGPLTEWWVALAAGLEQGWTVGAPPEGEGPLVFDLKLPGDPLATADGRALAWADAARAGWSVSRVAAVDAAGRALPARIVAHEGGARVVVDDAGATWPVTVDPLYSRAGWAVDGEGELGTEVGARVGAAGDVDADGYPDLLVPAEGSTSAGVQVYRGSPTGPEPTPAVVLTSDGFPTPAGVGDVDGDGYDDVLVGDAAGAEGAGEARLYLGSAGGLSDSPALTLYGEAEDDGFGYALAGAGDVDGDGFADVVIGAYGHDAQAGRAYVYLGSPAGLDATPAAVYDGSPSAFLGSSVAGAGDVDGDGYDDVLIGARLDSSRAGRVYVLLGSAAGPPATPSVELATGVSQGEFGYVVTGVGDLDGDGYDDVVIGAPRDDAAGVGGKAYVYRGSAAGLAPAGAIEGAEWYEYFGASVAGLGDVDGDGYPDVAVGAYAYGSQDGRVSVYAGSAGGLVSAVDLVAPGAGGEFGGALAGVGDVDGDGLADLLVGAPREEGYLGRAYLYPGAPGALSTTPVTVAEGATPDALGYDLSTAGDVDGDGYDDVVVGAPGYRGADGRVFVYLGGPAGPSADADLVIEDVSSRSSLGEFVLGGGDVNGDGYADLVLVDENAKLYQHLGGPGGLDPEPTRVVLSGGEPNSASGGGDVNGDGYDDVIVGQPWASGYKGRLTVYYGSAGGLVDPAGTSVVGAASDYYLAEGSAVVGDVNGDGYDDVVASVAERSGADPARAVLYLGGPDGLQVDAPLAVTSEDDGFSVVEGVGDVNGDGYADVALGTLGGGPDVPAVYVHVGSPDGLVAEPFAVVSEPWASGWVFPHIAHDVDVDGDGYDDLVIGYAEESLGLANTGVTVPRVSVYRGSPAGLAETPDLVLTGDAASVGFGSDVANGGDVDGDGCDDLLVGDAYAGDGVGRAWWYRGCAPDDDGDGVGGDVDCDDMDPTVGAGGVWFADSDGDGFGDAGTSVAACVAPAGYVRDARDCDDTDAGVNPWAEEVCDGVDDDCDGLVDEVVWWWIDADGDGWGDPSITARAPGCAPPPGYTGNRFDCDDDDAGRNPGATEVCDGVDDDCDGRIDEEPTDARVWYPDDDGDGYGARTGSISSCGTPPGYVTDGDDCDDRSAVVHPGAIEVCDRVDDDCDGAVDEDAVDEATWFRDKDGDGYGTATGRVRACGALAGFVGEAGDCDDTIGDVHPGAAEAPGDGIDGNCDGRELCHEDRDADGWRTSRTHPSAALGCDAAGLALAAAPAGDCDDDDASVHPSAKDPRGDGVDQDCDGRP